MCAEGSGIDKKSATGLSKKTLIIIVAGILLFSVVMSLFIGFSGKKIIKLNNHDYDKVLKNVSAIGVTNDKERYIITEDEAVNKVVAALKSVRVKARPIKIESVVDPYVKNQISINGKTFYFNENFEKFFVMDDTKRYTYKVINVDKVKTAFQVKNINNTVPVVSDINVGSDVYGLTATVKTIELNGSEPYIEVEYSNNTDKDYMNGESFDVLYKIGAYYKSCAKSDLFFNDIGYLLKQGETRVQKYNLYCFDFSRDGKYRFETEFSGNDLWVEFELENKYENEINSDQKAAAEQEAEINRLREKYPQYFNLPTENGLEVYIDLLKLNLEFPTTANCRLFAGNNLGYTHADIEDIEGVSEDEMKLILSTYTDIPKREINVVLYYHPLSRYKSEITEGNVVQYKNKLDIYDEDSY